MSPNYACVNLNWITLYFTSRMRTCRLFILFFNFFPLVYGQLISWGNRPASDVRGKHAPTIPELSHFPQTLFLCFWTFIFVVKFLPWDEIFSFSPEWKVFSLFNQSGIFATWQKNSQKIWKHNTCIMKRASLISLRGKWKRWQQYGTKIGVCFSRFFNSLYGLWHGC